MQAIAPLIVRAVMMDLSIHEFRAIEFGDPDPLPDWLWPEGPLSVSPRILTAAVEWWSNLVATYDHRDIQIVYSEPTPLFHPRLGTTICPSRGLLKGPKL